MKLDPLRASLFLLTILTVSRVHQNWHILSRLRPALVLAALAAAYAFLNPRQLSADSLLRTWPAKVVAALGVWACLSVAFGISLGGSAVFIITDYSKTLIYAFLLIVAIRGVRDLYAMVWAYVISCGILVYFALFVFGLSRSSGSYTARLSDLYTFDANDIGAVLMVGLALTILTFQTSRGKAKVVSILVLAGIGAAIARSGSRGAFVALIGLGAALLVMLTTVPLAKRLAFVIITVVGLVVAAPQGYWVEMKTLISPTQDYNWDTREGRRQIAIRGMGYMLDYPIFGLGIDNFWRMECLEGDKAKAREPGHGIRCTPAHNSYVQAGAELGIPGLILWSWLVVGGIVSMYKLRRRIPAWWRTGDPEQRFLYLSTMYFAVALVGFGIAAFFVSFAWVDIIYIMAGLMAGLYKSVASKQHESSAQARAPAHAAVRPPVRRRRGDPVTPRFLYPPG